MSAEQPRPLQGYRESQQMRKDSDVDAKRIQEEFSKVQEADESRQRDKRNLKKSEEQGDDEFEEAKKELIQASGALFSYYMKDSDENNLFAPQTPQYVRGSEGPSTTSSFTIEYSAEETQKPQPAPSLDLFSETISSSKKPGPAQSISYPQQELTQPQVQPQINLNQEEPKIEPVEQTPELSKQTIPQQPSLSSETFDKEQQTPEQQTSSTIERVEKKQTDETVPFGKTKKPSVAKKPDGKEKTPTIHLQDGKKEDKIAGPSPLPTKEKEIEKPKSIAKETSKKEPSAPGATISPEKKEDAEKLLKEIAPEMPIQPQKPIESTKLESKEDKKEKGSITQSSSIAAVKQENSPKDSEQKQKEGQEDKSKEGQGVAKIEAPAQTLQAPQQTQAPAYANLSPQLFELFERMIGLITVEQLKGVTQTTVTINMKNSVFDGAQIILDHYSTAPSAFNVTIAANPQAQELLTTNIQNMAAAFEASKLSFQVNLKKPILLDEYQALRKKEKVSREKEEKEQKQK